MNRGYPQVGGTCVKHHSECLRRGAQVNLTIVLSIKVVLQGFWSGVITGGKAKVVLEGVFVSQKLLNSFP